MAQPGDVAPRPLDYASNGQPSFDRHCVRCHNRDQPDSKLDLSGEMTDLFNRSYENLLHQDWVSVIQEWITLPRSNPEDFLAPVMKEGNMAHVEAKPPRSVGSHASRLIEILRQGHYDVELPREDFIKLVTWIDANAPYYGSYFGRRNLRHKDHPDFRRPPTLASASGIPPEPKEPTPVAASLIAHWSFDEDTGATTADQSPGSHHGQVVRARWTPEGAVGGAMQFDGTGYVEVGDLGTFDTLTVAMWVKAGVLKNTWNPLLFCHGFDESDLHVSLLTDGAVNVALNSGTHLHRHSRASVADGRWHHVAVVVDARYGGNVRFHLDGKLDRKLGLDAAVPITMDGFRLGAYRPWETMPDNNFHGSLDDVRVYRGMLTREQVAKLAGREP